MFVAALANPLTLAIVAPALIASLLLRGGVSSAPGLVGSVDVPAAAALLLGPSRSWWCSAAAHPGCGPRLDVCRAPGRVRRHCRGGFRVVAPW
ncbi:hypothetical protein [Leifsonia sp. NPDC080035]|uniref:Uncharacterized protein n=1 Tax=Leifsonia sp. NPDC080035 TaxID=3143936 RepID=A0AAU7GF69_9MICO